MIILKKIAWIGTGVMGSKMLKHLYKEYKLNIYNRTYKKALALKDYGNIYDNIIDCIKDCDYVISIVGYPNDVLDIYDVIIKNAKKNTILIDMTTSSPTLAKNIYHKALDNSLFFLDAPVTGSDIGATNHSLSIMVGGDYDIFLKSLPIFNLLGKTITYMGDSGNGQNMKLTNQIVIASNISGIAEAITFAKYKKLDLNKVINVIEGGSANSWQAVNNGRKMINKDYEPGFYIKHFLKDLKLVFEEKDYLKLPIMEKVKDIYEKLNNDYYDKGTQYIIEYYLKINNLV